MVFDPHDANKWVSMSLHYRLIQSGKIIENGYIVTIIRLPIGSNKKKTLLTGDSYNISICIYVQKFKSKLKNAHSHVQSQSPRTNMNSSYRICKRTRKSKTYIYICIRIREAKEKATNRVEKQTCEPLVCLKFSSIE